MHTYIGRIHLPIFSDSVGDHPTILLVVLLFFPPSSSTLCATLLFKENFPINCAGKMLLFKRNRLCVYRKKQKKKKKKKMDAYNCYTIWPSRGEDLFPSLLPYIEKEKIVE